MTVHSTYSLSFITGFPSTKERKNKREAFQGIDQDLLPENLSAFFPFSNTKGKRKSHLIIMYVSVSHEL